MGKSLRILSKSTFFGFGGNAGVVVVIGIRELHKAELEAGRATEPEHPLLKTFLAIARFQQGRVEEAQALVEEVLRQSPQFDAAQPLLAWCRGARGSHEEARALITDRVKEVARADHDVAFWVGCFYAQEGLAEEALEWLRRSVFLGNEDYPLFRGNASQTGIAASPLPDDLEIRWQFKAKDGIEGAAAILRHLVSHAGATAPHNATPAKRASGRQSEPTRTRPPRPSSTSSPMRAMPCRVAERSRSRPGRRRPRRW